MKMNTINFNRFAIKRRAAEVALCSLAAESGWTIKDTIVDNGVIRHIYVIR